MPAVNLQLFLGCETCTGYSVGTCIPPTSSPISFHVVWCKELVNTDGLYRTVVAVEMAVNGTLEQFGEYSDGLWLPADFLEEYRFMVAQVIVRISAEGNE